MKTLKSKFNHLKPIPDGANIYKDGFFFTRTPYHSDSDMIFNEDRKEWHLITDYAPTSNAQVIYKGITSDYSLYEDQDEKAEDIKFTVDGVPRPPLGILPQYVWLELRRDDLIRAIAAYIDCNEAPLDEWYKELGRLIEDIRLNPRQDDSSEYSKEDYQRATNAVCNEEFKEYTK